MKNEEKQHFLRSLINEAGKQFCQCGELSNINDSIIGINTCVKCDKPIVVGQNEREERENEQNQHNMEQTASYGLDTVIERHEFNELTGKYVYFFRDANGKLWKESEGNVIEI